MVADEMKFYTVKHFLNENQILGEGNKNVWKTKTLYLPRKPHFSPFL
jgi:hypothetical protein